VRDPRDAGGADAGRYYGTVVADPSVDTGLPVLHLFTESVPESMTRDPGARAAVYFDGEFHDNALLRRRGVTAMAWPKPKIKLDFKGPAFRYSPDAPR